MHFYLNIHISRLFNSRFIRTHPFKSFLASKSWRKRAVGWFSWKLKTKKIAEAGESWAELQYLKFFCFSFWWPSPHQWPWHGSDWFRSDPSVFLGGVQPSGSDQVDCRWRPTVWDSKTGGRKIPFIVKSGPKILEKNKAHQRNQIVQQYWPLGNITQKF